MKEFTRWRNGRMKSVKCIMMMLAFVFFMLLCSIYHKNTEVYARQPTYKIDSLYLETIKKKNSIKRDTTKHYDGDELKHKIDSIDIALQTLDNLILTLEKQTEIRQNDIRQETNNIINKFNGNIEWWIFLLGIICGVAPIILTILTHQKDEKYIEFLCSDYEKLKEQIKSEIIHLSEKEEELEKLKVELKDTDEDRRLSWDIKQKELRLVFSFMYISSFTRKSKFQASEDRGLVVEKLMREIVDSSLRYLTFENSEQMKKRNIDISFWILASVEGMELLRPFLSNAKEARQMDNVLKKLHDLRDRYYKGDVFKHDDKDIESLKTELETLKAKKWE